MLQRTCWFLCNTFDPIHRKVRNLIVGDDNRRRWVVVPSSDVGAVVGGGGGTGRLGTPHNHRRLLSLSSKVPVLVHVDKAPEGIQ
jgi:hypothetical protein